MPVLKHERAREAARDAIVLDMADLRRQAAQIIAEARAQAQRIVDEARANQKQLTDQALQQATKRGHAEGLVRGLKEGSQQGHAEALRQTSAQLQTIQTAWIEAAQSWEAQRDRIDREARQAVLMFAFNLAEKIVHRAIEVDQEIVIDQVASALAHVLRPLEVSVHIHPEDRPALEEAMPQLLAQAAQLKHIRFVDDSSVERGGCIVQYGEGQIDATIDTQLQRIAELVMPAKDELPTP